MNTKSELGPIIKEWLKSNPRLRKWKKWIRFLPETSSQRAIVRVVLGLRKYHYVTVIYRDWIDLLEPGPCRWETINASDPNFFKLLQEKLIEACKEREFEN